MKTPPALLTADELKALYRRLDRLVDEVTEMQNTIGNALIDNRQRDQRRVTPERRTSQRTRKKT